MPNDDPFAPVAGAGHASTAPAEEWAAIAPVPETAPKPPQRHGKLGRPGLTWRYLDAEGRLLFLACRFDQADGKQFLPLSFCRNAASGKTEWRWKGLPEPRPLYGLDRLAARPDAPVIVAEGEKAADAAARLMPAYVAVTSPNGSKSARKTDWSPLVGRQVLIWPDADEPGIAYAEAVAELVAEAGAAEVSLIQQPQGLTDGFDAADALGAGWTPERLSALVSGAKRIEMPAPDAVVDENKDGSGKSKGRGRKHKARVFDFIGDSFEFWRDQDRESYCSFPAGDHFEHWPIRHRFFKSHIAGLYYRQTAAAIGATALEDALRVFDAMAQTGPTYPTWRRVGGHGGEIFLDLADDEWRSVRVTKGRWTVGSFPHVKFLRSASSRPLPVPEPGGGLKDIAAFANVAGEDDIKLLGGWLVGALRPEGPYPILAISGEQGSGKSSVTDFLANLIDAEVGKKRSVSKDERDLVIAAANSHVLSFDNLSGIAHWFSDALCRLATGGGFATRELHTDAGQIVFEAQRPIILNGIPDLSGRADLSDRCISLYLPRISESTRRTERQIKAELQRQLPYLLGALLDAVSVGLARRDSVHLESPPRMADFAEWVEACAPAFGWKPGEFLTAYAANREDASKTALENDPFATWLLKIIRQYRPTGFVGTATALLNLLDEHVPQTIKSQRSWPSTAAGCGTQVRRCAPLLRAEGFRVDTSQRSAEGRRITISPLIKPDEDGSEAS